MKKLTIEYHAGRYFFDSSHPEITTLDDMVDFVLKYFGGEPREAERCKINCSECGARSLFSLCMREKGHPTRHACRYHGLWGDEQPAQCGALYTLIGVTAPVVCFLRRGHAGVHSACRDADPGMSFEW